MPIPGLTDIYQFSDWAKLNSIKPGTFVHIEGVAGGLIRVSITHGNTYAINGDGLIYEGYGK